MSETDLRPHAVLRRPAGHRRGGDDRACGARRQYRREQPVLGPRDRPLLHAAGLHRARGRRPRGARARAEAAGRALRHADRRSSTRTRKKTIARDGQQVRPCAAASALPDPRRLARCGGRGDRLQPRGLAADRRATRASRSTCCRSTRRTRRRRRRSSWSWCKRPAPTSSSSRATCRCCRTVLAAGCSGGSSTSTTRSCPASRAPSPITRRTSAASRSSARRRTT